MMKSFTFGLMLLYPVATVAGEVSTVQEFDTNVMTGGDVVLKNDLTLDASHRMIGIVANKQTEDLNIDGEGYTIYGGGQTTQFIRNYNGKIGEIKNITFEGFVNRVIEGTDAGGNKLDPDDNQGATIINMGELKSIDANFYNNQAFNGGAIYNGGNGHIGSINGEFKGNKAWVNEDEYGDYTSSGAVIHNNGHGTNAVIDNITGLFEDNTAYLHGVIWNGGGTIKNITATFNNNHRSAVGTNGGTTTINGSTFYKNDTTGRTYFKKDEDGNFIPAGNYGQSGAAIIYYGGKVNVNDSRFEENRADWKGGAIASTSGAGVLNVTNSVFLKNSSGEQGGAIYTAGKGVVNIENSQFISNKGGYASGAIHNIEATYTITDSLFDANGCGWVGGIYNGGDMTISGSRIINNTANTGGAGVNNAGTMVVTDTEFSGNKITYWGAGANGGAISNSGVLSVRGGSIVDNNASGLGSAVYISAGEATLTNVRISGNESGNGGAVHSLVDLTLAADGDEMQIAGNNTKTNQTGVFMATEDTTLHLNTTQNGRLLIDDVVDGNDYNIRIGGDNSGQVEFHNEVNHLKTLTMASGGTLVMAKDKVLHSNNYVGENGNLRLDVEADYEANTLQNGRLEVAGDVSGTTNVFVHLENDGEFADVTQVLSPFVNAPNDTNNGVAEFKVGRVERSPYMWESRYNVRGDEEGSVWYLAVQQQEKPTEPEKPEKPENPVTPTEPVNPIYTPEVAAFAGMQSAAIEQNHSIADSVAKGISAKNSVKCYGESCKGAEILPRKQAWVDVTYESAKIDSPAEMEADINGTTVGIDLYRDKARRAGVFAAYRSGKYDLSGKGKYYSSLESDITNKSYLGGAYYQYDDNNWRLLGTVFAGKQDMDLKTADRLVRASTDAMQYGASAEVAKQYAVGRYLNLEPSLEIYYTMIDIDDIHDNAGKSASFDTLHFLEAELGLKIDYVFCRDGCTNKLYMKPSVIRTFQSGGKTKITGITNEIESYKNRTLGRMEIGGEFGLSSRWTGYLATGYTFGDDYKAYDVKAGLDYYF